MLVNLKEEYTNPYNINHEEMAQAYATFRLNTEEDADVWKNQKVDYTFTPYEED